MKKLIIVLAALLAVTGCAAKRYDSATKIKSETTITQDSAAPITSEMPVIPMAGQTMKQAVGEGQQTGKVVFLGDTRSLNGKNLVEVKFVRKDGSYSVLEVMQTGERFKLKGNWGEVGDQFKIERP